MFGLVFGKVQLEEGVSSFKMSDVKDNCCFLSVLFTGELQILTIARFRDRAGLIV